MAATLSALQKELTTKVAPVYYFSSEESFIVDEALSFVKSSIIPEGVIDFNYDSFFAREVDASKVRDIVETLPVMAPQRLIVVRGAHEWKEKSWNQLNPVLENPVNSSVLVFEGKKLDGRKKYVKALNKNMQGYDFAKPFDNQIPEWIGYLAAKHQVPIDDQSIKLIHQLVGTQLSEIQNELIKLKQYVGERKQVTSEDVMKIVSRVKVHSIFDLTKAIGNNDRAGALMCLAQLLDGGQNEVGILALVSRHVKILRSVKDGVKDGLDGYQLASRVGVPNFFLKEYRYQANHWSQKKIENTFRVLLETDRALKLSPMSSHIWLENFVIQTCN